MIKTLLSFVLLFIFISSNAQIFKMEQLLDMTDQHVSEAMLEFKIRNWQVDHTDRSKKQIEITYYSRVIFRGEKVEILLNQRSLKKSESSDIVLHFSNPNLFEEYKLQATKLDFVLGDGKDTEVYANENKTIEFITLNEGEEISHEIRVSNSSEG